jgi:hypothetical protein
MFKLAPRSDPFWNLFAGSFGGVCSLVVGYPLDTLKVRMQVGKKMGNYYNFI